MECVGAILMLVVIFLGLVIAWIQGFKVGYIKGLKTHKGGEESK